MKRCDVQPYCVQRCNCSYIFVISQYTWSHHPTSEFSLKKKKKKKKKGSLSLTCGKAVFSCLCKESLSWLTSCSLPWVKPRFSWVSLKVSRRRSLSSSMDTISDSKWPSESDCSGEPEPRRPPPPPPPGPSASLMVGITSHIIYDRRSGPNSARGDSRRRNNLELDRRRKQWGQEDLKRKEKC